MSRLLRLPGHVVRRHWRVSAVLLALGLAAAAPAPGEDEPPASPPPPAAPPAAEGEAPDAAPRVLVRVDRDEEVLGHVELEDESLIVVRTHPYGDVRSFLKSRVAGIVRMVDPEPGQRGVLLLRTGQLAEGEVLEDGFEHVVMIVEGIRMRFPREHVDHVKLEPTFDERYANYKASLGPRVTSRHLALCRWLMDERRYDLAKLELVGVIRAKPDSEEARQMLRVVEAQLAMQKTADSGAGSRDVGVSSAGDERHTGPVDMKDLIPTELVSARDVNIMRVYEIDFTDPPEVAISPETIRTLLERYGSSNLLPRSAAERTALFRADPIEIVRLMFELRARELYPEIQVLSEPRALNMFRQRVHNAWLINTCSTTRCHGGPYAGRLFLHRSNSRDERVRYTNLLILERLELDDRWPLVNYDVPADSLIIQYGLPREVARKPHPDVRGWRPVFTAGNQRLLRFSLQWIDSMMQPRPDYPVDYEPPRMGEIARPTDRTDR